MENTLIGFLAKAPLIISDERDFFLSVLISDIMQFKKKYM